jgi:DNA-binding HxlR family transcriptional regulator
MQVNKLRDCPALLALQVLSGKWKTRLLWLLSPSPRRFGQLRRALPDASAKVLAAQLRELAALGIIRRTPYEKGSVQLVEYELTAYGRTLIPALDALGQWGLENLDRLRKFQESRPAPARATTKTRSRVPLK